MLIMSKYVVFVETLKYDTSKYLIETRKMQLQ